jgi:hypothetical protein
MSHRFRFILTDFAFVVLQMGRCLVQFETFGNPPWPLAFNGTKVGKKFPHRRHLFRFWRGVPLNVIGNATPLLDDEACGDNDPNQCFGLNVIVLVP